MNAYIFFSVHEELFRRVAEGLRPRGVKAFSGFVWGEQQQKAIAGHGIDYDLVVFTRDLLPQYNDAAAPDLAWIRTREQELGISIQRMLSAERHLLKGRSFEQIMRMVEVALRGIASAYDRMKPDFVFSEDISCFHSYVHFALARERGIPFWCISSARLPYRLSVYSGGMQRWHKLDAMFAELQRRGLNAAERSRAEEYVTTFRDRPVRPSGMATRARKPKIELADWGRLTYAASRYFGDRGDPTAVAPLQAIQQRLTRMARVASVDLRSVFEPPVAGEKYVLYPIHFQPEASTLVQAPMYLDQVALLRDMAASLPGDHRLYVKEHVSNRGRRPIEFYEQIKAIPSVRLLGPDEDTWSLIKGASVIAVITGTVGWEGLIFDKPVVTFGDVFFNQVPQVYRAGRAPKDDWYRIFDEAATKHVPDRQAVLCMVSALQQASHPGFIANPASFPEVLEPENVANLATALADEVGLPAQHAER
jgi:hypothetical protein